MNQDFVAAMRRATQATRAFDLAGATGIIQDAIAPNTAPEGAQPRRKLPYLFAPTRARPEKVSEPDR